MKKRTRRKSKNKNKNNKRKFNLYNTKVLILAAAILALVVLTLIYFKIITKYRNERIFALEASKYAKEIANPIFEVDKILVYSGANVEDSSENQDLTRVDVSQYTDFAIYINNFLKSDKLTEENTVNRIYINNIAITANQELGTRKFSTKNIDDLGKYISILDTSNEIKYDIIHRNKDKDKIDNNKSFYTDCSEPLILSYVNENIVQSVDASASDAVVSLDGSILKHLNIGLDQLNYKLTFTINIENNLGEQFLCNCSLDIDLGDGANEGIYSGSVIQSFDLSKGDYKFKKV